MSILDRDTLDASPLADLHAIASELSLDGYRRLRKADLIDALIVHQGGTVPERPSATAEPSAEAPPSAEESPSFESESDGTDDGSSPNGRRRRGRRGGRGRGSAATSEGTEAESGEAEAEAEPKPSGRTRSKGRNESRSEPESAGKDASEIVDGVVELLPNGSGFVRVSPPEQSDDDVYISAAQVKRCELVTGDRISGPRRAPHRSERFPSLVRVDTVNGKPASEIADRARFDDLPCEFPSDRFKLGSEDATLKAIEFLTPFGRGSRVTIVGERWSGKSHALRLLAAALSEQEGLTVLVALAGVRPEEITSWSDSSVQPQSAVSFATSAEAQDHAVELVVDQAKRLAARGEHAVVLIDTLDGLQSLTARKVLAAARNITGGGSLTVVATATEAFGGETTVICLSAVQTGLRKFPALDLPQSGTLQAELLVGKTAANAIVRERAKALK